MIYKASLPLESCGRWGETEIEKDPVDLFPVEPTDEAFMPRRPWTLGTWDSSACNEKRAGHFDLLYFRYNAEDGT